MKKNKNTIIMVTAVVLVIVATFLISKFGMPKAIIKLSSYDEYKEVIKGEENNLVYFGKTSKDEENINAYAKENGLSIYYLDLTKLNKKETKEIYGKNEIVPMLSVYNNNEEKASFKDDLNTYKVERKLIDNKILDNKIISVNYSEYKEIIKENQMNLMFLGTETCGYCQKFIPEVEKVLAKHNVNVYYLDIAALSENERQDLYASDEIFSGDWGTPLTLFYKNNKRVDLIHGYVEEPEILEKLKANKVI